MPSKQQRQDAHLHPPSCRHVHQGTQEAGLLTSLLGRGDHACTGAQSPAGSQLGRQSWGRASSCSLGLPPWFSGPRLVHTPEWNRCELKRILRALVLLCPFSFARSVLPIWDSTLGAGRAPCPVALDLASWFRCPFLPSSFTSSFLHLCPQCPPGLLSAPLRSSFPPSSAHRNILIS